MEKEYVIVDQENIDIITEDGVESRVLRTVIRVHRADNREIMEWGAFRGVVLAKGTYKETMEKIIRFGAPLQQHEIEPIVTGIGLDYLLGARYNNGLFG